jgi:1-acyl-sn-glycerol-3-phosphate acyltransferase
MPADDLGWSRTLPAVLARRLILRAIVGPLMDVYARRSVHGREVFAGLDGPVVLVANHGSHMDAPTILRSLPPAVSRRTAVAAAADYFYDNPVLAATVALAFGTVPVKRGGAADGASASNLDALVRDGWNLVVFAEGTRSRDGTVGRLRSGAAVLAAAHGIPIVPVHVSGTNAVMPPGQGWMRRPSPGVRGAVSVRFGAPIHPGPGEHRTAVMERVRLFLASSGAVTTPDKRVLAARRRADRQSASA